MQGNECQPAWRAHPDAAVLLHCDREGTRRPRILPRGKRAFGRGECALERCHDLISGVIETVLTIPALLALEYATLCSSCHVAHASPERQDRDQ